MSDVRRTENGPTASSLHDEGRERISETLLLHRTQVDYVTTWSLETVFRPARVWRLDRRICRHTGGGFVIVSVANSSHPWICFGDPNAY